MKALVVVDMQNDFVHGKLGTIEARTAIEQVNDWIIWANFSIRNDHSDRTPIIFTRDTHTEESWRNYMESDNFPIHCERGTYGWEIIDEIDTTGGIIIDKESFGGKEIIQNLKEFESQNQDYLDEIVVCGVCTDICVISTAIILQSFFPYAKIHIGSSACAGTSPENHEKALEIMKGLGMEVDNKG